MIDFDASARLRALQKTKGVSSIELASRLKVKPQQVSRWRKTPNLKIHTIQRVCQALDVSLADFLTVE